MRIVIATIVLLLAACSDPEPVKEAAPDDGCVGYMIKPDGSKTCVGK